MTNVLALVALCVGLLDLMVLGMKLSENAPVQMAATGLWP